MIKKLVNSFQINAKPVAGVKMQNNENILGANDFHPFPVKSPPAHLGLMNLPPGFDEPPTDDTNSEY